MRGREIITIDGPAGVGKSTVGREMARRLGYTYLDTGAMYRAIAFVAKERGVDPSDEAALSALCEGLDLRLVGEGVFVDGVDVSASLRTPLMDRLSSDVSRIAAVRRFLCALQRRIGAEGAAVVEGRDMGTVVFPQARVKIFLTASPEERARRRNAQLLLQGQRVAYSQVLAEIRARDAADESRPLAPLRPAPGALIVDSSDLSLEGVLDRILDFVRSRSDLHD